MYSGSALRPDFCCGIVTIVHLVIAVDAKRVSLVSVWVIEFGAVSDPSLCVHERQCGTLNLGC